MKISILEVEELDLVTYLYFLREAFIYNCSQTEEGRTYLKNAYRISETSPDRGKIREFNSQRKEMHN